MKAITQKIWSKDHEFLKRLADEQENYIFRKYKLDLDNNVLIVFPYERKIKSKSRDTMFE